MASVARIRILSVEDHPLLREGIAAMINTQPDMLLVGAPANGAEAIEAFRALRPDVTLMDLRLPDLNGIEVMIAIRAEFPEARIIVLTTYEGDVDIQRDLKAGAHGYMLKSVPPQQMVDTIRRVHAGQKCISPEIASGLAEHMSDDDLSGREVDVLRHVATGNRNRHIPDTLFIPQKTVNVHLNPIFPNPPPNNRT